jgi:hypothetical protein
MSVAQIAYSHVFSNSAACLALVIRDDKQHQAITWNRCALAQGMRATAASSGITI